MILFPIFDDGELQAESDLRRGETDARGLAKRLQHAGNGLLELGAGDFIRAHGSRDLAKNGISRLYDFQWQVFLLVLETIILA